MTTNTILNFILLPVACAAWLGVYGILIEGLKVQCIHNNCFYIKLICIILIILFALVFTTMITFIAGSVFIDLYIGV